MKTYTKPAAPRRPPDLPDALAPCDDPQALFAERDVTLAGRRMEEIRFDALAGGTLRLEECVLRRVGLAGSNFAQAKLRDVRLENCDLANLEIRALDLARVEFVNCRMTGFRAHEAHCRDVLVSEGDQRYAQFRFAKFRAAEFDACNFEDADLQGTEFPGCRFRSCVLRNAEMSGAKLKDADLRGSVVDGLHVRAEDLRGAVVDAAQALSFAYLLGIRIR